MPGICLIAEHDPWDIQLLRLYAERVGFQVVEVFQTQDVLPKARQVQPQVIVLESELPGARSSLETACELAADPDARLAAVVLFSGPSAAIPEEGSPAVQSCLQKPATYEAFRQALIEAGVRWPANLTPRPAQPKRGGGHRV